MVPMFIRACLIAATLVGATAVAQTGPTVLRATYIAQNPVQAFVDPASGRVRGPAADITRALAQQLVDPPGLSPRLACALERRLGSVHTIAGWCATLMRLRTAGIRQFVLGGAIPSWGKPV